MGGVNLALLEQGGDKMATAFVSAIWSCVVSWQLNYSLTFEHCVLNATFDPHLLQYRSVCQRMRNWLHNFQTRVKSAVQCFTGWLAAEAVNV